MPSSWRRPAALGVVLLAIGCGRPESGSLDAQYRGAPVILISIDTLRADHLPLYGYKNGSTPVMDRVGREAIVFDDAYSHSPLTLPSHASLLTGLLPTRHGVRDNIGYMLKPESRTLAARFKSAGYATGGAVSAYVLRHQTGIANGFDFFDDAIEVAGGGESLADTQRDGRLKAPLPELYDLSNDPSERRNVMASRAGTASALAGWIAKTTTGAKPAAPPSRARRRASARTPARPIRDCRTGRPSTPARSCCSRAASSATTPAWYWTPPATPSPSGPILAATLESAPTRLTRIR